MHAKKPTRRQKEILYRKFGLNPDEWLVARWLPDVEYVTLVSRFTGQHIQKWNPDLRK